MAVPTDLRPIWQTSATGILPALPALHILTACHRLEVVGVHAVSDSAQVVEMQAVRDRANDQFVRESVSPKTTRANTELAVAVTIEAAGPEPATIRLRGHVGKEPDGGIDVPILQPQQPPRPEGRRG